jgi:hypothetical protein
MKQHQSRFKSIMVSLHEINGNVHASKHLITDVLEKRVRIQLRCRKDIIYPYTRHKVAEKQ